LNDFMDRNSKSTRRLTTANDGVVRVSYDRLFNQTTTHAGMLPSIQNSEVSTANSMFKHGLVAQNLGQEYQQLQVSKHSKRDNSRASLRKDS
jgi:hypothetical protein